MFELTGKILDLSLDFISGKPKLTLEINEKQDAKACFDKLRQCEKLSIKVGKYREKRSLNANAYAWKLITEIGNALRTSKDEIYLLMLKRYGQSEIISALSHVPFQEYVKYCDEIGESVLNGKTFKHYKVYKGSSEFSTLEMSIFVDGIIDEAKQLGIQTETPEQIAKMKSMWGE